MNFIKEILIPHILALFFFIYLPFFQGCGNQDGLREYFRVGIEANPTNLDPRLGTDVASDRVHTLIFNGLLKKDENFNLVNDLAESFQIKEGIIYLFKLKKGVLFHDGRELTASDVVYTFKSILDPSFASPKKSGLDKLADVKAIDRYEVEFTLSQPFSPFLYNLTIGIVPEHIAKENPQLFSKQPIGTGPFKIVEYKPDDFIRFERFENYFAGPPKIKGIIYKIIPDDNIRMLELEKGSIDFIQNNFPYQALERLNNLAHLKVVKGMGTIFKYIGLNCGDAILKDKRVRQAIAYSIDRREIIDFLLNGEATLATSLLPSNHWAFNPELPVYNYDPEKARMLLDEAGFKDPDGDGPLPRFSLIFKTSQDKTSRRIAEKIQFDLKKADIDMEIRSYEWATFYQDIKDGNFQIYSLKWVGIDDPDIFYYCFHSSSVPPNGANRGRYFNSELDALLVQARLELDRQKRAEIYCRIQSILADELPYINLWHENNIAVMHRRVNGFRLFPAGEFISFSDLYLKE